MQLRSCARILPSTDGAVSRNRLFVAGNAIEVVPPGNSDGTRHTLTRIFDVHATDADFFDEEVLPLVGGVASGVNAALIIAGHYCTGRGRFFEDAAGLALAALFEALDRQRETPHHTDATPPAYTVRMAYGSAAAAPHGLTALLSHGTTEVAVVHDPASHGGFRLSGMSYHPISRRGSTFDALFRTGRARLAQQQRTADDVSSVLLIEVELTAGTPEHRTACFLFLDVQMGGASQMDSIAAACSRRLRKSATEPEPSRGVELLLRQAVGGNSRSVLLGLISPAAVEDSMAVLRLLAHGSSVEQFPLVNDILTRGLLQRFECRIQALEQQLDFAQGKLARSVEALEADSSHMPGQLALTTDRLQALVDNMQQEAAGQASTKQSLMAELASIRAQLNSSIGQAVGLKEELVKEKEEKMAISRELISAQLSASQSSAEQQQRLFELEQQAVASADVMQQLQHSHDESLEELVQLRRAHDDALVSFKQLEAQYARAAEQLSMLRSEAEERRVKETALTQELSTTSEALVHAEKARETHAARADTLEAEASAQRERADRAEAAADMMSAAAERAKEEAHTAKLDLERAMLQAEQGTLCKQQQAADALEEHLATMRKLQEDNTSLLAELESLKARGAAADALLLEEVSGLRTREAALNLQLDDQLQQLQQLQQHNEVITSCLPRRELSEEELGDETNASTIPEFNATNRALAAQLHTYEKVVNGALQANRALHEAYWRLRAIVYEGQRGGEPFSLPTHEELQLEALIEPATGRRELPSEAEKLLMREKADLQQLLQRREEEMERAEERWRAAALETHRKSMGSVAEEQLRRMEQLKLESDERAERLQRRVAELEGSENNSKLVNDLRASQEELLSQLQQLRLSSASGSDMATANRMEATLAEMQTLKCKLGDMEAKLAVAEDRLHLPQLGGNIRTQQLQLQVRELTRLQGELERERTELTRRAVHAEAQLEEMQQYINANIGRYQKEILRLRKQVNDRARYSNQISG